ncbi:hypothetical protein QJQ45_009042 [Haematococcus lacustris]|nr:hypothetical protein QJQ45_009042 [Haematococcus lacustris]
MQQLAIRLAALLVADQLDWWKLTKGQVKHASGLNNSRRDTQRWQALIKPHLQHLAAASSVGTSLVANLKHITVTLATWDAVWGVYLDPNGPPQAPTGPMQPGSHTASEPGPSSPPPAKRSKRTKAEQAAEPTQPTKGKGKAKGKAAKVKPAPQPGRWVDSAAMQH